MINSTTATCGNSDMFEIKSHDDNMTSKTSKTNNHQNLSMQRTHEMKINILTNNITTWKDNTWEDMMQISAETQNDRMDIMMMQETNMTQTKYESMKTRQSSPINGASTCEWYHNATNRGVLTLIAKDKFCNTKQMHKELLIHGIQIIKMEFKGTHMQKLITINIYRPHKKNGTKTINLLKKILKKYDKERIIIGGDFNAKMKLMNKNIKHSDTQGTKIENEILTLPNIVIHNDPNTPTCYYTNSKNKTECTIDLVMTKNINSTNRCVTQSKLESGPQVHYHIPISLKIKINLKYKYKKTTRHYIRKTQDWQQYKKELNKNLKTPTPDAENNMNAQCKKIITSIHEAIKLTTMKIKKKKWKQKPIHWSKEAYKILKEKRKTSNKLTKLLKLTHPQTVKIKELKRKKKKLSNILKRYTRKLKQKQHEKLSEKIAKGDSEAAATLKRITTEIKKIQIPTLKMNDTEANADEKKAEMLGAHYAEISSISTKGEAPLDYPKRKHHSTNLIDFKKHYQNKLEKIIKTSPNINKKIVLLQTHKICMTEINYALQSLNKKAAPGKLGINLNVILKGGNTLTKELLTLYNMMLKEAKTPDQLLYTTIAPIPKTKQPSQDPAKYRPIAVPTTILKIFEHIILQRLNSILMTTCPTLLEKQHGWLKEKSTFDPITKILSLTKRRVPTAIISLDIRKFFDTIPQSKLIIKLKILGISGSFLEWIKHLLENIKYSVKINNYHSTPINHFEGIPQGSLLSPILAAIYCSDIPHILENKNMNSYTAQYADDNIVIIAPKKHYNIKDKLTKGIQNTLEKFYHWCILNGLQFNTDKMKIMITKSH